MEKKDSKTYIREMVKISKEKSESWTFYKYLCQKIGSEEVVRIRRLASTLNYMGESKSAQDITSGSIGEGLKLKGSDLDIMTIDPFFKVYESETEANCDGRTIPLIMNTEETQPCFTQLCLLKHHHGIPTVFQNIFEKSHRECVLSSELYKLSNMSKFSFLRRFAKIHGPCVSDMKDTIDLASCLKCDKWIFQARSWVSRPRTTWPSTEIISKIISCGVLFVPIGCKGSINENLEWRLSFSVAEKFLIFAFSHTQLLCYAMLKIVLKEIVEKHDDLNGLLCSYFIKTMMFWLSEETDPNFWRPNNIITCFMACLERLLYCVRYSILSHYFIPDNNLFYLRFTSSNKEKLITILTNLYEQGIDCFAYSKTLQGYKRKSCEITESFTSGNRILEQQIMAALFPLPTENVSKSLQYHLLHHSRTGLCKEIFALYISKAYAFASQFSEYQSTSENKHYYFMYKHDLSHLLIGLQSDAVSVLLMLASFFYVHKNYLASLTVVKHALQKYTDEKIYTVSFGFTNTLNDTQKYVLKLMKNEKIYTVLKSVTIYPLRFHWMSAIIPQELQRDVADIFTIYHPLAFAHFLSFLCYYHLHDIVSCRHSLQQIESKIKNSEREEEHHSFLCTYIFCGIAHQLMGDTNLAKKLFHQVVEFDDRNATSAAQRLSSLM